MKTRKTKATAPTAPAATEDLRLPLVGAEQKLFALIAAAGVCKDAVDVEALLTQIRNYAVAAVCQRSEIDNMRFRVKGIEANHLIITPVRGSLI